MKIDLKLDANEKMSEGYFIPPGTVVLCTKGLNHRNLAGKKPSEEELIDETIKVINHEVLHLQMVETENIETSERWDCLCLSDPEYI